MPLCATPQAPLASPRKGAQTAGKITTHQAKDDNGNEAILTYINGRFLPKAQVTVSAYDSGFMLGDGVWERLRLYFGRWPFLDEHFARRFEVAKAIDLGGGLTRALVAQAHLDTQTASGSKPMSAHASCSHASSNTPSPASCAVALRAHDGHHHEAFAPQKIRTGSASPLPPTCAAPPMAQNPKLYSHSKPYCFLACIAVEKGGVNEAFLIGTFGAQTPAGSIDGRQIGTGEIGPLTARLHNLNKTLVGA